MALTPGTRLGPYEVIAQIGEGGMGVVYKAVDTRLARHLAIKVLSANAVGRSDRKRRFLQEARAASALNHPGIVHIYDIGTADGIDFIAMEYVEGETLDAIGRSGQTVDQALTLAVQIADALAAAHAAGIVHRDIKPGNIMVTGQGLVKVLDFGLAKLNDLVENPAAATETAGPHTAEGAILGTVSYMSPEQAEGRIVDARSDIFSFGAVLYEMLTGRRAFEGASAISTLAAILHQDPVPVRELAAGVPRGLARIVARCLEKDPQRRMQLMADVKLVLQDVQVDDEIRPVEPQAVSRRLAVPIGTAVIVTAVLVGVSSWLLTRSTAPEPRFTPFATETAQELWPAWSPDGKTVAYLAEVDGIRQVFTRSVDSATPVRVTTAPANCDRVFWDPDGTRVYFASAGSLWSIGLAGGEARLVVEHAVSGTASPDGKQIAIIREGGASATLWTVALPGGQPSQYQQAQFPAKFREGAEAHFSPDGSKIAVALSQESGGGGFEFWLLPNASGAPRRVIPSFAATGPVVGFDWMPDSRHLVFSAELSGVPGWHLYSADTETNNIVPLTPGTGQEQQPAVSPDGKRIAFVSGGTDFDLIQSPVDGGALRTLLSTTRTERFPSWSPNGTEYVYSTNASGTFEVWLRSVAADWARPIVTKNQDGLPQWRDVRNARFSPDGHRLLYELWGPMHSIWISPVGGGRPTRPGDASDEHGSSWSPDGNQIAYTRNQGDAWALVRSPVGGGPPTVVVDGVFSVTTDWTRSTDSEWIAFSAGGNIQLVSPDGRRRKTLMKSDSTVFGFSRDGSTVYVVQRRAGRWELVAVDVKTASELKASPLDIPPASDVLGFSLALDGKTFATSVASTRYDLWLMEGFHQP